MNLYVFYFVAQYCYSKKYYIWPIMSLDDERQAPCALDHNQCCYDFYNYHNLWKLPVKNYYKPVWFCCRRKFRLYFRILSKMTTFSICVVNKIGNIQFLKKNSLEKLIILTLVYLIYPFRYSFFVIVAIKVS